MAIFNSYVCLPEDRDYRGFTLENVGWAQVHLDLCSDFAVSCESFTDGVTTTEAEWSMMENLGDV
jgi:hypothetical protein